MKRVWKLLVTCLLMISLGMPLIVYADEELWSETYARIMDTTGEVSAAEKKSGDALAVEVLKQYHVDVAAASIPDERLGDMTVEEFACGLYESSEFGYGENKDGFMCIYLADSGQLSITCMGNAAERLPQKYLDFCEERVPSMREKHGVYGVLYSAVTLLKDGLQTIEEKKIEAELKGAGAAAVDNSSTDPEVNAEAEKFEIDEPILDGSFERVGEGADKPSWFPADLEKAYSYYDPDAPRIVDMADIFSPEAEEKMKERISEITAKIDRDIVIVTDISTYGLGEDIYAADFYDYNGYGIGPDHEGICLMLNMDPKDRGGWTCETGPETRALMTRTLADRLDDFLYDTLASGDYDKAALEWIEDVYSAYTTGMVRAPRWYLEEKGLATEKLTSADTIVVDDAGMLTQEEYSRLEEAAVKIREDYGVPVYVHTSHDPLGMDYKDYQKLFVSGMGYEEDCVLFALEIPYNDSTEIMSFYTFGNTTERIPEKFRSRIENNASSAWSGVGRMEKGEKLLAAYLKNGRVPRNSFYWGFLSAFAALLGSIFGGVELSKANKSMKTISVKYTAYSNVDKEKTYVNMLGERFLYKDTVRVYDPPKTYASDSSSSSSSSRSSSSYKSSYSGHSGTSHSGHGRKF